MTTKHFYIIKTKWFRIYFRGSYSLFEIDFGKSGCKELVIHLFNIRKVIEWKLNYKEV